MYASDVAKLAIILHIRRSEKQCISLLWYHPLCNEAVVEVQDAESCGDFDVF